MANNVRIGTQVTGVSKASSDLDNLKDKFAKLQSQGAKGFAIGAGAVVAAKGLSLMGNAADAAVGFVEDSIKAASDLNETLQKSSVVFGDAESDVESFGKTAARSMGLSEDAAIGAAASIGNLLLSTGTAKEKIAPMSEAIVKLASDLASFNNISVEDALAKLQSGLVGQERPLRELGVAISAASVDTEALALGFKKVNGEFTEGEKVQARYSLIFKQTGTAQGDFARTADQMANQQRILQAELEDTSAKFGKAFIPVVIQAQREVIHLSDAVSILTDGLSKNGDTAAEQTKSVLDLAGAFGVLVPGLGNLTDAAKGQVDAQTKLRDAYDASSEAVHAMHESDQKDFEAEERAGEHFQRSVVGSLAKVKKSALDLASDYDANQRRIRAATDATVKQLAKDAKALIDGYFDPIETRAALHDQRLQLFADQDALRTAKNKEEHRQASDAIIQDLDDEGTSLAELGDQGKLTKTDVQRYTSDVTAYYKSMGKKVPPELQKVIDHLNTLAGIHAEPTVTVKIYGAQPLDKLAKELGYIGNTDLYKKGSNPFRAKGGPVKKGQPYVVGENHPEVFVPDQNGRIDPRAPSTASGSSGGMSGSVTYNVTVNAGAGSGLTPGGARQLAAELGPALYADMQRRGMLPRTATGLRG